MFGAIYIGLSGMNAYSKGLQQISNNVTNLNSSGFKGSTVSFRNYYSGGQSGVNYSGDPTGGNGVTLANSRLDFSSGDLQTTNSSLDLAVRGNGFLVLLDGDKVFYTRTGSFEVDQQGYIVHAETGYRLATLNSAGRAVSLSIDPQRTNPPEATTKIRFADYLSSSATDPYSVSDLTVWDSSGGSHDWTITFTRNTDAEGNAWTVAVTDEDGTQVATSEFSFGTDGVIDPERSTLSIVDADSGIELTLDFSDVSSFSAGEVSTLRVAEIDGFGVGTVTGLVVNADGEIELSYSNEQTSILGALALADFRDPQALSQMDGGIFEQTHATERLLLASTDPRMGDVLSNRLEASNVDLSAQFGDLIMVQRGFQASSQIVSVANDMIQQLFGIRGQG
ncbi:flagellar hook protein FlgE [Sphingosinithalassobacter portus]|uniref:flagellar hook protein FlgE n=1 Tax=Stakelama portus TaxID=2676234 RepID=UPI000D6E998B|nr:flagellar hook-basal body complex protein [Sphingosinithalassobacter portus]